MGLLLLALCAADPASAELAVSQLIVEFKSDAPRTADIDVANNGEERSYVVVEPKEIVHPGMPGNGRIGIQCHVVKRTVDATLIELANDPRGKVWVPFKHVRPGTPTGQFDCETLWLPVWLFRKVREQL